MPGRGDRRLFTASLHTFSLPISNKRSITLDYEHPKGRELLEKLLITADVLLINQPSLASLRKRELDPDTLMVKYPRLIYCAISGYGLTNSSRSGSPGYDIIAQAEAGVMSFTGEPQGEPVRYPVAIADMTCGIYARDGGYWRHCSLARDPAKGSFSTWPYLIRS